MFWDFVNESSCLLALLRNGTLIAIAPADTPTDQKNVRLKTVQENCLRVFLFSMAALHREAFPYIRFPKNYNTYDQINIHLQVAVQSTVKS